MNAWRRVRVGEVASIKHGFAFSGEYFVEEPTNDVLVTPGNFAIGGGFKLDKPKYYRGPVPSDFVLSPGELIVTMTDLSKGADTLGYGAVVPSTTRLRLLHNQRIGKVLVTRPDMVILEYLHWALRTSEYRQEIIASASGSTVKHTAPSRIEAYTLSLPPIGQQRAIAHILGTLDDKIELNRKMNETLEQMARALFKSWFVDFDPVHAKAAGRTPAGMDPETAKLFPSEFQDSELGRIPKGWRVQAVSESIELAYGKALPASVRVPGPYPVYGSGGTSDTHNTALVSGPGIIIGRKGSVGTLYWSDSDFFPIDTTFYVNGAHLWSLRWLFMALSRIDIAGLGADSAVPGVNRNAILGTQWVFPSDSLVRLYGEWVSSFFHGARIAASETESLKRIRDILLPRLLSGDLLMRDAERFVETLV